MGDETMRTICATVLSLGLAAPQLFAEGPIARSVTAEAGVLAAQQADEGRDVSRWGDVKRLEPGRQIFLTTVTRASHPVFVTADDASVVVIHPSWLPSEFRRQLIAAAQSNPDATAQAASGGAKAINAFVIGPDGVFVRGAKLAERSDVIERVAAADVLRVSLGLERRGSTGVAASAATAAVFGAVWFARFETWGRATVMLVGIPAAAGAAAWYGSSEVTERVIYRAPARP
jgi:hypothetical protein